MIIGVDIGGTKTLISCFAENGKLLNEVRFETSDDYDAFLVDLEEHARALGTNKAKVACVAVPGLIDRDSGMLLSLGNLPWKNKNIRYDVGQSLRLEKVYIENDSKLAGLGEAKALQDSCSRIYYITISTGIGGTLLINGEIARDVIDGEIGMVPFPHEGEIKRWEDFASGRAFLDKYGKRGVDIDDPKIWEEFSHNIGIGISMICCIYQVDAIIFGGGLGQHVEKFEAYLKPYVSSYLHNTIRRPKHLLKAHHGEESVIYGCYEYAKNKI